MTNERAQLLRFLDPVAVDVARDFQWVPALAVRTAR